MELVVLLLFLVMVSERLWRWARKVKDRGTSISQAGLDDFHAAFQASKRAQIEQRESEQMLRDEEGDAAPPARRIDLVSGKVTITVEPDRR
ncbi:DUF6191 domain-containing protein [Kitasatospora phosalacinea]|uniref:Uncharacterized protein n=1 Tax=Kitasatospora phosalacinea TaxID=2065 RepID=A0A9W6PBV5_9ACTN|nr:DUF6191 domain-containing protein [Kitasatospora phosalacinea]GLW52113.1 hypothetical protein Kpho01_01240 [Kitasatospora phosalacinea]